MKSNVNLIFSSNAVGQSNDETIFSHKLLLTNSQVSKTRKVFANSLPANTTFPKTQLSKVVQLGELLGRILGPLVKTCLHFVRNIS